MSYGPIWYEWNKRPANDRDDPEDTGRAGSYTMHFMRTEVTELYWCQPALYAGGGPGQKRRLLVATIYPAFYRTDDEARDRVALKTNGFIQVDILTKVIEYALDHTQTQPGTSSERLSEYEEY